MNKEISQKSLSFISIGLGLVSFGFLNSFVNTSLISHNGFLPLTNMIVFALLSIMVGIKARKKGVNNDTQQSSKFMANVGITLGVLGAIVVAIPLLWFLFIVLMMLIQN